MLLEILYAVNVIGLLTNGYIIYKLRPDFKENVKNKVNNTELQVQKTEMLLLDLKHRMKQPTNIIYD